MKPDLVPPLLTVPLHILADVISHFDTIQQLGPVVLSHPVFHDALQDNLHSVAGTIIRRQIPAATLPFLIALLESTQVMPQDHPVVQSVLKRMLASCTTNPSAEPPAPLSLLHLSIADYAFLSINYTSADLISKRMASEALALQAQRLRIRNPARVSRNERFRIHRALFRYQLMCNLFCHRLDAIQGQEEKPVVDDRTIKRSFFSSFSPWVNEELVCVFAYLQRKVAEAFDDLAAHDVLWGHSKVRWDESAEACSHIQWFLCQGLPFLSATVTAKTFENRSKLLQHSNYQIRNAKYDPHYLLFSMRPRSGQLRPLGLLDAETLLRDYSILQVSQLDPQGARRSSSFRAWFTAHLNNSLFESVFYPLDWNLWEFGYVFWNTSTIPDLELRRMYDDVRGEKAHYRRLHETWQEAEVLRSERRREDIYAAGGRGYWPREGVDFGGIQGLTEAKKEMLESHWVHNGTN